MTVVSERAIFMIFAFFVSQWYSRWLESVSTLVIFRGERFGRLYLPPGGLGRSSESFFHHDGGFRANHFCDFCNFFASQWYSRWWESVSTFVIFCGERFGMQYLPPGGLGRSSESFFHHDGGVRVNHFYDFCNFLRTDGTLGGWKVS